MIGEGDYCQKSTQKIFGILFCQDYADIKFSDLKVKKTALLDEESLDVAAALDPPLFVCINSSNSLIKKKI